MTTNGLPATNNNWTNDEITRLKELAKQNKLHAREIAGYFPGKSRNAILGKLFRLGLHLQSSEPSGRCYEGFWSRADNFERLKGLYFSPLGYSNIEIAAEFNIGMGTLRRGIEKMKASDSQFKAKIAKRRPFTLPQAQPRTAARARALHPPMIKLAVEATPTAMPIMGLKKDSCRWPVQGEGHSMLYCGTPTIAALPYCGAHCRRAYASAIPRRL